MLIILFGIPLWNKLVRLARTCLPAVWVCATLQVSMDKVQSYGEAFTAIQQATGITDIDELVNRFVTAEDENFRLYRCALVH